MQRDLICKCSDPSCKFHPTEYHCTNEARFALDDTNGEFIAYVCYGCGKDAVETGGAIMSFID